MRQNAPQFSKILKFMLKKKKTNQSVKFFYFNYNTLSHTDFFTYPSFHASSTTTVKLAFLNTKLIIA